MTIHVGQMVRFKFGRMPKTAEGKRIAARRAHNMAEMRQLRKAQETIEWEDMYAVDEVYKVDESGIWVGDVRDGGYCLKIADIVEVL